MKELFKAQRDDSSRAGAMSSSGEADADGSQTDAQALAVTEGLKSVLRMACDVTAKV